MISMQHLHSYFSLQIKDFSKAGQLRTAGEGITCPLSHHVSLVFITILGAIFLKSILIIQNNFVKLSSDKIGYSEDLSE